MEEIRKWVQEMYQIKLLAISSHGASSVLSSSSLTPEDLLNPFCDSPHSLSVKSLTKTINCSNLHVKVVEKLDLKKSDNVVLSITPKVEWNDSFDESKESISNYLSKERTPWFNIWKDEFFKSLNFSSHELIDMPLGIIYLASTTDADPLHTFQNLARAPSLPSQYSSKIYDSNVPKIYLLIHDPAKSSITNNQIAALHEKISKALIPGLCFFVLVNTGGQSGNLIWDEPGESKFSNEERIKLQIIVNEILVRAIVPYIESSLKSLDLVLEQKKRGIKNSISKFFSKKERSDSFAFQTNCMEHVCRLLADFAFLIGDYEEAANHYKAVSNDLKNLKAWAHTGSVYEMMAICSILCTGDSKEAENFMDTAYAYYQKSGDQSLIVRCLLLYKQLFNKPEYGKKVALKLISSINEIKNLKLIPALFMEQAAFSYLQSSPAYFRKFAFYQVLAGDEFRKLELVQHALNCYFSVSHLYKGKKWEHIEMHINHMMGRFCYFLNMQIESVHFFLLLSSSSKLLQHREQHQKKIINELLSTVAQWMAMPIPVDFNPIAKTSINFHSDGKPILDFSLPRITGYSVLLPQDRFYSNSKMIGNCEMWKNLLSKNTQNFMDDFKYFDGENVKNLKRALYCGENIEVIVKCFNPMSFSIVAENLTVIMMHESGEEIVTQAIDKLELNSNEEKIVVCECRQDKPGKVKIQAFQWSFNNAFYGNFNPAVQEFFIKPPVSGLFVSLINFPDTLLEGQVQNLQIVFRNQSLNPVSNVSLIFSHSFIFGKGSITINDLAPSEEKKVDMWIRGEKIGIHTVRFVAFYQSQEEKRYCRLQSTIEIKPSLKISSRYESSLKSINESILQLCLKPALESRLTIKQIASLSGHSLRLIKELASEVYFIGVENGQYNAIKFDEDWVEPSDVRKGFCWDVKNMLKKNNSNELDLIVSWELEINETVLTGHHYLLDLKIKNNIDKFPYSMTLSAPTALKHDFKANPICKAPVKICVKNLSQEGGKNVLLEAQQNVEPEGFIWVGCTTRTFDTLPPGETIEMEVWASFQLPGCYNLNKFSLKVNDQDKELPNHLHQILIS